MYTRDQNNSSRRRWAYLMTYNRADNDPVYVHDFPGYTPMIKVGFFYHFPLRQLLYPAYQYVDISE